MRILFLSHFIPHPPTGGASLRNYNLIRQLARSHKVDLLTFTQTVRHPTREQIAQSRAAMGEFCRSVEVIDLPTDYSRLKWYGLLAANTFSAQPYSAWRFQSRAMLRALERHLGGRRYDIVHVDTIALAGYLPYLHGVPAVLNHHNVESSLLLRRAANERHPAKKAYLALQGHKLRRAERRALTAFAGNVAVSELDRRELQALAPEARIAVVPNGTDTEFFRPSSATSETVSLVFAGSMSWYPNRDAMILFAEKIWPLIRQALPNAVMHVIGSAVPPEVRRVGAQDPRFRVLGFVDDVRPYIAEASVYVVPIRVGGGTRLKILDAMAMGKAIVSHSIGAEGLDLEDGKEILIADPPEAFARQVIELVNDAPRREALARAARATAEAKYAWSRIAPRLEEFYRQLAVAKQQQGALPAAEVLPGGVASDER